LLKYWWLLILSGILLMVLGIYAIQNPHISLPVLVKYLGMVLLLWGGLLLVGGIHGSRYAGISYFWILESAVHLLVGGFIFTFPEMATTLSVIVIGIWASALGIIQIFTTKRMGSLRYSVSLYVLNGILGIAFGIFIMFYSFISNETLITFIGTFCLLYGVSSCMIAIKMRSVRRRMG